MRWDTIVEKMWKDTGGDQEEVLSTEKIGAGTRQKQKKVEEREKASAKE